MTRPTAAPQRYALGELLAGFALLVTTPYLMRVFFHIHGYEPWGWVDTLTKVTPAFGLGIAGTLGGAYIGSTLLTHTRLRGWLGLFWALILIGMVYVISGYLVAEYTGQRLDHWLGTAGLWAFMIASVLVPELAAVGSLLSASVRRTRSESLDLLTHQLDAEKTERKRLAGQLDAANAAIRELQLRTLTPASGSQRAAIQPTALQALRDAGTWWTVRQLRDAVAEDLDRSVQRASLRTAVSRLVRAGYVTQDAAPLGWPERYVYAAVEPGQEPPPPLPPDATPSEASSIKEDRT
ncbi:MAG: hypothetical protein AAGD06_31565 [Acidobacteriota bacterium]